jgi:ABC-type transport system involved in cytochrome c biogenesis permease component
VTFEYIVQFYIIAIPIMMIWEKIFNDDDHDGLLSNFLMSSMLVTVMVVLGVLVNWVFDLPVPEMWW